MLVLSLVVALLVAAVAFSMVMSIATVVERRTGNAGWVDTFWTFGLGLVGAGAALAPLGAAPSGRQLLVAVLVAAWSLRLGSHIAARARASHDDPRYAALRQQWGRDAPRRMALFLQIQVLVSLPMIAAAILAAHNPSPGLGPQDLVGALLAVAGIAGEAVADRQLRAFRAARAGVGRGRICDDGLWGWSRHPNYFFEWLTWVGVAVIALDVSGGYWVGWLAVLGPACMYWLLVHVSGIPPLEEHMLARHGAAFRAYQARTSAFFPRPPRPAPVTEETR